VVEEANPHPGEAVRRICGWVGIAMLVAAFGLSFASREQLANWSGGYAWAFWSLTVVGGVLVVIDWWTHYLRQRAKKTARKQARKDRLDLDL